MIAESVADKKSIVEVNAAGKKRTARHSACARTLLNRPAPAAGRLRRACRIRHGLNEFMMILLKFKTQDSFSLSSLVIKRESGGFVQRSEELRIGYAWHSPSKKRQLLATQNLDSFVHQASASCLIMHAAAALADPVTSVGVSRPPAWPPRRPSHSTPLPSSETVCLRLVWCQRTEESLKPIEATRLLFSRIPSVDQDEYRDKQIRARWTLIGKHKIVYP